MRAFLTVDQLCPAMGCSRAAELFLPPLVDRPFLQHVVEAIVDAGARELKIILTGDPALVAETFGNGSRWGVALSYHCVGRDEGPWEAISAIQMTGCDNSVLVARADTLPRLGSDLAECTAPRLYSWNDHGINRWTGWAILRLQDIQRARAGISVTGTFDRHCLDSGFRARTADPAIEEVPRPLLTRSYDELIESHLRVLENQRPDLLLTGTEIAPGIRIWRNATIHRTARLFPPVFIGQNARIGEHCRIGPGASIGRECFIESRTAIENSVVCPGTYVGEGLELREVYVDRGRLVNTRFVAEVQNVDELLLGSVHGSRATLRKKVISWIR